MLIQCLQNTVRVATLQIAFHKNTHEKVSFYANIVYSQLELSLKISLITDLVVCSSVSKILALFRRLANFPKFVMIPRLITSACLEYVLNWQTWKVSSNYIPAPFATFDSYLIDIIVWLTFSHSNQRCDKGNILEVCSKQINCKIHLPHLF